MAQWLRTSLLSLAFPVVLLGSTGPSVAQTVSGNAPEARDMALVGYHDLQGRSAYQPIIQQQGGRFIAYIGHHGGTALNPLTGKTEPNGTSIVDVTASAERVARDADQTAGEVDRAAASAEQIARSTRSVADNARSLQESVVPVITVRLKHAKQPQLSAAKVSLSYKNCAKRVTTRLPVVDLLVEGENMFSLGETFEILLEAHNKKGDIVGEAKRGGPIDVATGTVTVKPGGKVQVTIKMAEEFEGKFVLKALNPVTMAQYASLEFETDYAV